MGLKYTPTRFREIFTVCNTLLKEIEVRGQADPRPRMLPHQSVKQQDPKFMVKVVDTSATLGSLDSWKYVHFDFSIAAT